MKVYFAGDIPENSNAVNVFLAGITNLGNSWRYYVLEKIKEKFENENVNVFIPEPKDASITTWGVFMKNMPKDYDQVQWEIDHGKNCQVWTMFLPTYVNRYDSGPTFATPSADPFYMHSTSCKALKYSLDANYISEKEYSDAMEKLTFANLGCQARFEAGYLAANLDQHKIVWGKVWNSQQINFGPYIPNETMHVLQKEELDQGHFVPDTFIEELLNHINNLL